MDKKATEGIENAEEVEEVEEIEKTEDEIKEKEKEKKTFAEWQEKYKVKVLDAPQHKGSEESLKEEIFTEEKFIEEIKKCVVRIKWDSPLKEKLGL